MSIPIEKVKALLKTYDKNTVYYKRDILGQRIAAEGLIYNAFANDPEAFIIDHAPDIMIATIGVDFGGNGSAHAFNCTGLTPRYSQVVTLDEHYRKEIISPEQLEKDFVEFVQRVQAKYRVIDITATTPSRCLYKASAGRL
jgi:Phage terminase large subunit.